MLEGVMIAAARCLWPMKLYPDITTRHAADMERLPFFTDRQPKAQGKIVKVCPKKNQTATDMLKKMTV